jgi:hypothetical protein
MAVPNAEHAGDVYRDVDIFYHRWDSWIVECETVRRVFRKYRAKDTAMSYAGEDYPYPDQDELTGIMTEYKPTESRLFYLHQNEDGWVKWAVATIIVCAVIAVWLM